MKKSFALLMTFMMLISSLMCFSARIYAEEETAGDEQTQNETVEALEEEGEEVSETVEVTEEQSREEGTGETLPAEEGQGSEEEVPTETGEIDPSQGEEIPAEPAEGTDHEISEEVSEETEAVEEGEELTPAEDTIETQEPSELTALTGGSEVGFKISVGDIIVTAGGGYNAYLSLGGYKSGKYGDEDGWISAMRRSGSHIDIYDTEGNLLKSYSYGGKTTLATIYFGEAYYFLTHNHAINIDLRSLIDAKIPGGTLRFEYCANGYTPYTETVDLVDKYKGESSRIKRLVRLCIDAPSDISFEFTPEGDMIIDSDDKEFLKALAKPVCTYKSPAEGDKIPAKTSKIGGGFISIDGVKLQNTGKLTAFTFETGEYESTGSVYRYIDNKNDAIYGDYYGTVVIPNEFFLDNNIMDGMHQVVLSAEGYLEKTVHAALQLNNEPKVIDVNKVNVAVNADGAIEITTTDSEMKDDFFDMLTLAVKGERINSGGRVNINGKNIYNKSNEEPVLVNDGNKITISSAVIKKAFNNRISGEVNVTLNARGFNIVEKKADLPYIIVDGDAADDGSSISLNVPKTFTVASRSSANYTLKKKEGSSYVPAREGMAVSISNNDCTIVAQTFGSFCLEAVTNGVKDALYFDVTAPGLKVTPKVTKADAVVGKEGLKMEATASTNNGDVSEFINYRSENESIATVDDQGNLTFKDQGTVKIYAYIADVETYTTYSVYLYDKSAKLTYRFVNVLDETDVYDSNIGLEVGEKYKTVLLADGEPVAEEHMKISSSAASIVSADGLTIEGKKSGKATITITLDDLVDRKVSAPVSVISRVFYTLRLDAPDYANKENVDGIYNLFFDSSEDIGKTVDLTAIGTDKYGNDNVVSGIKYTSLDTSVVSVNTSGVATIKKAGQVTVTATVTTNPAKMETVNAQIIFRIFDYTPKLEANKVSLNKYLVDGTKVGISSAYSKTYPDASSEIAKISISDETLKIDYTKGNDYFEVAVADSATEEQIKALKSGKRTLTVETEDIVKGGEVVKKGQSYDFDFTVTVTAVKPAVTTKVTGTYNTFTNDNTLLLTYSAKNANIEKVEFLKNDDLGESWARFDETTGEVELKQHDGKFIKSGTIRFFFDGYNEFGYVDKKVAFLTVATKPAVKLETSTVTLYDPAGTGASKEVAVRLINKKVPVTEGKLTYNGKEYSLDEDGYVTLSIPAVTGKVALKYKEDGWNDSIALTLNVKALAKLPTVKLASSKLTYNIKYQDSASVAAKWSAAIDPKFDIVLNYAEQPEESDLDYDYKDGTITVKVDKAGTYKLTLTPLVKDDSGDYEQLKNIVLTVNAVETDPKITLKTPILKLNQRYNETLSTLIKVPTNLAYEAEVTGIAKVEALKGDIAKITFDQENNSFNVTLKDSAKAASLGNYGFDIYPEINGKESKTPVRLTVSLYNKEVTAAITLKGTLNQLDEENEVLGTIKLSNIVDSVKSVSLDGSGKDVLNVELNEDNKVSITLKENADVKDGTLKPTLTLTTETGEEIEKTVSVKVARKAPTLKVVPATVVVYDTTNNGIVGTARLVQSGTVQGKIKKVTPEYKSDAYKVTYDAADDTVKVELIDGAVLKAGTSVIVMLRVDWEGDYGVYGSGVKGLKTSLVKFVIKDITGTIKSK